MHARVFEGRRGVILAGSSGFGLATAHKLGALVRVDGGEHVAGATS